MVTDKLYGNTASVYCLKKKYSHIFSHFKKRNILSVLDDIYIYHWTS